VAAFQTAIESGDLERAVELYGGGFLDGLFLKDALEFEEWAREERDRFSRAYAQALDELAENAIQRGDHPQAVSRWRDLVAHDPYSGRATVRLMESLAAAGDRAEALRQADAHAVQMREAFDAAPDGAVTELANRLREKSTEEARAGTVETAAGTEASLPRSIGRRWLSAAVVVAILGLAGWYIALKDQGAGPEHAPGATAAPAIAVLPFSVRGEELAVLREGMVDLLSTGLDGVGGLRTIPASTLLVRWHEHVPGEEAPELTTALEVARRARAQYALVGSVVAVDSDVRIVVDIYDANTDERLGKAQVEGSPDDVLPLVDRLAVEVLQVILEKGEEALPEIDLSNIMSDTTAAVKAYLDGEVHSRHWDLPAAVEAYKRAVEADSAFALAHYRLSNVYGWGDWGGIENATLAIHHRGRAVQLADRLPARQALIVRAVHAVRLQTLDAVEPLRQAVQTYPDDAEAWYQLGDMLYHYYAAWATAEEIDQAFDRAVELDPRNAHYLVHYLEFAWRLYGDSAVAAERLEMFERIAPGAQWVRAGRLALDLAFGDSVAQDGAMTQLRSEQDTRVVRYAWSLLVHPRYAAHQQIARLLYEQGDDNVRSAQAGDLFNITAGWYGRLREALPYLDDPAITTDSRAYAAYRAFEVGLPIPKETLDRALDPALIDSVATRWTLFHAGAFAVDHDRWSDHADAIEELERRTERAFAEADSFAALRYQGTVRALEGYALWRQGQPTAALSMLEDPQALRNLYVVKLWLGRLYQELGRFRDAERVYRSHDPFSGQKRLSTEPLSQRQLGKIYEQLEEYEKALESYEYFVHYWRDADPELQPMVEEARRAIVRLEGLRRE
jgi:tetratricopeptide (TPR) repeat protein